MFKKTIKGELMKILNHHLKEEQVKFDEKVRYMKAEKCQRKQEIQEQCEQDLKNVDQKHEESKAELLATTVKIIFSKII